MEGRAPVVDWREPFRHGELVYDEPDGLIICADCRDILPKFPAKSVDLVLTDPPYGVGKAEWDGCYISVEGALLRVATGVVVNCGDQNIAASITSMGDEYRGMYYGWNMNGMTRGPLGYMNIIPAVCGGKLSRGMNFCKFIIQDLSRKKHPAPKPIEFYSAILQRFSVTNQIILDPFLGSGTTAVAAVQLNRRFIGIEISREYCELAADRVRAAKQGMKLTEYRQGQKPLFGD